MTAFRISHKMESSHSPLPTNPPDIRCQASDSYRRANRIVTDMSSARCFHIDWGGGLTERFRQRVNREVQYEKNTFILEDPQNTITIIEYEHNKTLTKLGKEMQSVLEKHVGKTNKSWTTYMSRYLEIQDSVALLLV